MVLATLYGQVFVPINREAKRVYQDTSSITHMNCPPGHLLGSGSVCMRLDEGSDMPQRGSSDGLGVNSLERRWRSFHVRMPRRKATLKLVY
jgi:hypothetical protein